MKLPLDKIEKRSYTSLNVKYLDFEEKKKMNLNAENTLQAVANGNETVKFDGGVLIVKAKRQRYSIQVEKSDGIHTLGMLSDGNIIKDFGQMNEVIDLLNKS